MVRATTGLAFMKETRDLKSFPCEESCETSPCLFLANGVHQAGCRGARSSRSWPCGRPPHPSARCRSDSFSGRHPRVHSPLGSPVSGHIPGYVRTRRGTWENISSVPPMSCRGSSSRFFRRSTEAVRREPWRNRRGGSSRKRSTSGSSIRFGDRIGARCRESSFPSHRVGTTTRRKPRCGSSRRLPAAC